MNTTDNVFFKVTSEVYDVDSKEIEHKTYYIIYYDSIKFLASAYIQPQLKDVIEGLTKNLKTNISFNNCDGNISIHYDPETCEYVHCSESYADIDAGCTLTIKIDENQRKMICNELNKLLVEM